VFAHLLWLSGVFPKFGAESLKTADLEKLAKFFDVTIETHDRLANGASYIDIKATPAVIRLPQHPPEKYVAVLAHELGHVLLHRWLLKQCAVDWGNLTDKNDEERRRFYARLKRIRGIQANYFMTCAFWPEHQVQRCLNRHAGNAEQASVDLYQDHSLLTLKPPVDITEVGLTAPQAALLRVKGHVFYSDIVCLAYKGK